MSFPGHLADSAGQSWEGRTLGATPFADDDGTTPPKLARARERFFAGLDQDLGTLVDELATCRVLVPIVAVAGQTEAGAHGLTSDKEADMAVVTVTSGQGVKALLVFSSVAGLAAWSPDARPVPVEAARAAQSAVAEGCTALVLDPAEDRPVVVPRPAVWAMGQGMPWIPALRNPSVHAALEEVAAGLEEIRSVTVKKGKSAEIRIVLGLRDGLNREQLNRVLTLYQRSLAESRVVAEGVDGLELALAKE